MSKEIKDLVSLLSVTPFDSELNFKIAQEYESLGQNASAISFYLRAAEYGLNKDLVYCSLLKVGICLQYQGERDWNVSNSFLQAIQHCPDRPEAYYLLSKFYERTGSWQECHTITEIGIHFSSKNLDYVSEIVGYKGKSYLEFQKAISAWWIDRKKESESLFLKLSLDETLDETHKTVVTNNVKNLGLIQEKIAIVLPVRDAGTGRSQRLINCLNSWKKQSENLSDVHVIIDEDDTQHFKYLLEEQKENVYIHIKSAGLTLMEKINTIGLGIANTYNYMIFIGDDIVFETPWESRFIEYLKSVPAGLVYANTLDLPEHIDWASHPCITTNLVRAVGFYGCPAVHHNYFDNFWSEVAKEIGYFHKMSDVIMDHRRIGWTPDHIYQSIVELQVTDKVRYEEYKETRYEQDLQKIKDYLNAE